MKDLLSEFGMNAGAKPEIFRNAQALRERMTQEERIIWGVLSDRPGGFKFRRQHPFGNYILDFFCYSARVSVELDGQHHNIPEQKFLDEQRTAFVTSFGVTELRFRNEEIHCDFKSVIEEIYKNLNK